MKKNDTHFRIGIHIEESVILQTG